MRVPPTARAKSRRPSRPFRRPAVEMLEDRSVPSAYTFARLTDAQSGAFQPDPTSAAINNGGAVAFIANLPDGVNKGIFLARGGSITTIVQSGPAPGFTDIGGPVSVNDAGVVAFTAVAGNTWGLYTSDGVTTRLLVQTGATFPINFQNPVINNAGAVAFYALEQTGPGTLTPGIFLASGGTVRTLVLGSPTFNLSGHFDLNNNGQVAFTTEDSQAHANVYVTDGTTLTPVALFGASLSPGFRDLAINDGGTVAFTAGIPGGTAVLTGNGGPLTTVATDTSHLVSFSNPVVNNVGDVAFVTRFSGGSTGQVVFGTGIYDGSSPTANKVIARPDPLDGLTFVQPLGGLAMNDTGQIGFVGQISNFTPTGNYDEVFRADPVLPAVSIGNATVTEGNSGMTNATFSVTLSGPLNKTVTVGYATADGTATAADNDYGPASGTLTFAPGETAKTVTVPVTGDARVEPDETFTVALSNPVHATIAAGTGTGTIRNDDVLPYTVTNTNDSGPGSLRQALLNANAAAGPVTIDFRIPATDPNFVDVDSALPGGDAAPDVFVIQPLTALPALNNPNAGITLDGRTQAAFGGDTNPFGPDVDLDGSVLTSGNGLRLLSNNNAVFGLDISRFLGNGIFINGGSSNNWVAGNYIGTDATGTVARGNAANGSAAGVRISGGGTGNVIGTNGDGLNDAAERNVISGNRGPATTGIAAGVDITGVGTAGNVVAGNYIGTDATGTVALGNSTQGVLIEAGASSNRVVGNVISGNGGQGESGGVLIVHGNTDDNVLTGNFIGTNAAGTAPLGNLGFGVRIRGGEPTAPVPGPNHGNRIGTNADGVGDAAERNLISGNQGNGVEIFGDSTNDLVAGNYIGTDVTGTAALGNAAGGVENRSSSTTVGGAAGRATSFRATAAPASSSTSPAPPGPRSPATSSVRT